MILAQNMHESAVQVLLCTVPGITRKHEAFVKALEGTRDTAATAAAVYEHERVYRYYRPGVIYARTRYTVTASRRQHRVDSRQQYRVIELLEGCVVEELMLVGRSCLRNAYVRTYT